MLKTILLNPLEQNAKKVTDLLNQLTQEYQQLLKYDKTLLLATFPLNEQTLSILEEIDLITTDLRGYASQIAINQTIQSPEQALKNLRFLQILENRSLGEIYFFQNEKFPVTYQYLQKLDYLKLLLIDWLTSQS
ncbi:MAG: hypothetical protein GC158_04790 [Cyanobacteria bacterium RI_101]|nr:hypothetical protein [Cyanobacteria bacterium RI_101]